MRLQALAQQLAAVQQELVATQRQLAAAETAALSEKEHAQQHLAHITAQHEQLVSHLTRRAEAAESQVDALAKQLAAAELAAANASSAASSAANCASSELATARADADALRRDLSAAKADWEAEKARLLKVIEESKRRAAKAAKDKHAAEVAAAEQRGKAEAERDAKQLEVQYSLQQLESSKSQVARLEADLKDYKARAQALTEVKQQLAAATSAGSQAQHARFGAAAVEVGSCKSGPQQHNMLQLQAQCNELRLKLGELQVYSLEAEVRELEKELGLHLEMEAALKETLRDMERQAARHITASKQVDMEYLKNLVLQLYTKGEAEALLPVFSTLLTFSKEERLKAQQGLEALQSGEHVSSAAGSSADSMFGQLTSWLGGSNSSSGAER
eukprot:gene9736-9894_t